MDPRRRSRTPASSAALFAQDAGLPRGDRGPGARARRGRRGHRVLRVGGARGGRAPGRTRVRGRRAARDPVPAEAGRAGAARERGALPRRRGHGGRRDPVAGRAAATSHTRTRRPRASSAARSRSSSAGRSRRCSPAGCRRRDSTRVAVVEVAAAGPRGDDADEVEFPLEAAFSRWSAAGETFTTAVLRDVTDAQATTRPRCTRPRSASAARSSRRRSAWRWSASRATAPGCFLRVNRALCDITGYAARGARRRELRERSSIPTDDDASDARYVPWMLAGEMPEYEVEKRLRHADGETIVAMRVGVARPRRGRAPALPDLAGPGRDRAQARGAGARGEPRARAGDHRQHRGRHLREGHGGPLHARQPQLRDAVRHRPGARRPGRPTTSCSRPRWRAPMRANDRRVHARARAARGRGGDRPAGRPAHLPVDQVPAARLGRGRPYAVCAIATDITERKRAEEALRESEEHFRQIVDTAHDAFVSIDAAGAITAWNPQAEETFGWSEREAVGRNLAETIIPRATARRTRARSSSSCRPARGRCSAGASRSRRCTATGTSSRSR